MSLNNHHFGIFIGLSLAMHAAVLNVIQRENTTVFAESTIGTLDVELITRQSADKKPQPSHAQQIQTQALQKTTDVIAQESVAVPKSNEASLVETADIANSHHDDVTNSTNASAVSKKISIEFLRYFYYPESALRRNWQGDVILQFTLLPDGHLDHIRIHQSSGYKTLDDAAIHALQQVKPQQELVLLTDATILHILPVSYRLTNPL